jgi:hypothetical protein
MFRKLHAAIVGLLCGSLLLPPTSAVSAPAGDAFDRLWQQSDLAVARGVSAGSWLWGPAPLRADLQEWYRESPGESREVRYYDKGRMELTRPDADAADPWFVTGGLLARDMIDGRLQIGDGSYLPLPAAPIPVAGDADAGFPTYADLQSVIRRNAALRVGDSVQQRLTPSGFVPFTPIRGAEGARISRIVPSAYGIPAAFDRFLSGPGIIYRDGAFRSVTPQFDWLTVVGYPLSDAFWVRVPVGGVPRDVLVQPFERRVLTFTPDNPPAFQVEMGNVGLHYLRWRYELPFTAGRRGLLTEPNAGAVVSSPLTVSGLEDGSAFEAWIGVRLRLNDGTLLAEQGTMVHRPDYAVGGPFRAVLTFTAPAAAAPGVVEVLHYSAEDGTARVIDSRQVTIAAGTPATAADPLTDLARRDLAARLGRFDPPIRVVSAEAVDWPDSALGCPAAGTVSLPVITPGRRSILALDGVRYEYRSDLRGSWLLCRDGTPLPPINAALREPSAGVTVTLPLFVEASLAAPGSPLNLTLRFADGNQRRIESTTLNDGRGNGALLAAFWPAGSAPPPAQPALLEIRDAAGTLLAAQSLQYVPPGNSATRTISLTWLAGEQLVTEQRTIPATLRIGTAALEALLWGPPPGSGLSSALPTPAQVLAYPGRTAAWGPRVRLNSLIIRDGVATADFSPELNAYGGGSLRVWGISQQIRTTLLQFPSIREVVISIDGRSGDVLQP